MDHVALDVSGTNENIHDRKRTKSLKRLWNQLSKCQRSCIYTIVIVLTLTVFYLVSTESEKTQISIAENTNENKKEVLNNIRNDPRDVDTVFHDNDSEGQVLEEPGGLEAENNRNQVLLPPKVLKKFTGPTTARQEAVVKAFKHAWQGYKQFAWGHDHLKPITEGYSDWFGLGLSIVDAIDTIYIMGLTKEYKEAREWIEKHLHFDVNRDVNLFEVTIRVLGGLLSIYHLTQDRMFITKAVDLADRLLPSFESESGIPYSDVNLFTRKAHAPKWSPDSSTSEVTTIQLEFRDLSRITGNPKYENAVSKVSFHIHNLEKKDGLVPIFINANTGQFRSYATITLGARGDSYYEYLLKQWLQTGKTIDYLRDDYVTSIMGVEKHLTKRTVPNGFLFIGELLVGGKDFKPKMDHLTCYLPGTLALGVHNGLPESHMKLAEELLSTCYQTYAQQPTFLAPEITYFNIQGENSNDMYVKTNDAHNLLRPEYLESLWYVYQLTGNKTYQDWGWQIFQGFENYTKVKNGYTSIGNVKNPLNVRPKDMMESFFLSETLKYLYLLFSDDPKLIDLDTYVINSEAHPLPIYSS
ncbi:endoplasmic reticulum mannosyl-oligosaccharide 1,2-alpha-mannosidase [Tribolium madens]|uniref:endoplasmic reticulum mannosyl-oligosaccharide 1,2-alpha-mannosidase n=1 Tax=Tribolium madens TaxID=41895 RepID=UPI001CF72EE0|nr:endoplasmic reticulum mannosyl-oligosaccharide 1,2-alpha-mannosidase [Tribolium madens]